MKPNAKNGSEIGEEGRLRVGDVHEMKNKEKGGTVKLWSGAAGSWNEGKGREGDGVERYTPCPCKVLRAVEAAAKNVSAQPSHAA